MTPYQILTLLVSIVGFTLVLFNLNYVAKTLKSSTSGNIAKQMFLIDQVFVKRHQLSL